VKILHVIDTLNTGGAEKVCLDMITLLLDAGHQVDCMVISAKGPLYNKIDVRAKSIFLGRKSKFNVCKMRKCAQIASGYDILHVHMRHTWAYVKLSCLLFRCTPKLIFHDHFGDISIDKKPTYSLKGLLKPRFYIGVSRELTEWAVAKLKIDEKSVSLLENIVIPNSEHSERYFGDWVMVSNLRSTKNIMFAIRLADKMKRSLIIFGNHDGSSYADDALELAEKFEFVRIVQNEIDIQQYVSNFKLGIHTAFSETGPLVLLEYMAQGLPFITSDTGAVVNKIREELPSFIVSTFDEKEWEKRINSLDIEIRVNGPALKQKLQYLFNEKFSPQRYLDQCLKIYQSVLTY